LEKELNLLLKKCNYVTVTVTKKIAAINLLQKKSNYNGNALFTNSDIYIFIYKLLATC